jgi:septal ring factor EnvC (AmiA/AmiB activator)
MTEVTNELLYEVLKKLQSDMSEVKKTLSDHDQQFIALREQLHAVQGDILRIERQGVSFSHRLERIEQRLQLVDA